MNNNKLNNTTDIKKEINPMRIWLAIILIVTIFLVACVPATTPSTEGKLRIITEVYPPYNFIDKDKNITGQSTEIVRAIMQKMGIQANIEVMPLIDGLTLVQKDSNTAIYSLNRTPQREELYKWVGPIGRYEQAFYAKKGTSITLNRLEDAKKVGKIGVYKGDAGNQFLVSQGFTNLDESQNDSEALKKLIDNKVQIWLGNTKGLEVTAKEAGINPDELVVLPIVVIQADLYIAFNKNVPDSAISAWQKALDSLKQETDIDGKTMFDKIRVKYEDPEYLKSMLPQ
jgi:polar amino acid transport system substrate-binding protein